MAEIDGMDMLGYLKVRAWKAKREQEKKAPVHRYNPMTGPRCARRIMFLLCGYDTPYMLIYTILILKTHQVSTVCK